MSNYITFEEFHSMGVSVFTKPCPECGGDMGDVLYIAYGNKEIQDNWMKKRLQYCCENCAREQGTVIE